MNSKISVITVVYNDKEGLEKTIQSVLSQTYDNIEYVIIDGGSTDGTVDIIKKYEEQIDIWVSEPDRGIFDAMNKGIRMSSGEWLNFMNAGDFFYSNNALSDVMENLPESAKFIYSDSEMRFGDGRRQIWKANEGKGDIYHQSSVYKRELHNNYGYYCEKTPIIMSDVLFFNLIPSESFYYSPHIIASYDMEGVSVQNISCRIQISCLKYVFHKISFGTLLIRLIKFYIITLLPDFLLRKIRAIKKTIEFKKLL